MENMIRSLTSAGAFDQHPFTLVDIGCSGGISPMWRVFEPHLVAVGIDPVREETLRLNADEKNRAVEYVAAFVGLPDDHPFILQRGNKPFTSNNPWNRLSAQRAIDILRPQIAPALRLPLLNDWNESAHADPVPTRSVSEIAIERNLHNVDFIKIDIDGRDMDALLSAEATVRSAPVLGLALEVNFIGSSDNTDHTFHNTDRLMRAWGFDLFDLTVRRYSAASLPQAFRMDKASATELGRPVQGDAVYLRDPCAWVYAPQTSIELDDSKILKLACLFELFNLPDHAAELLTARTATLGGRVDTSKLLDILAQESQPPSPTVAEHRARFERDPTSFYRSRVQPPA